MILERYFLDRVYLDTSTPGSWYDRDHKTLFCKTLELPWRNNAISSDYQKASCIPEGIYLVELQQPTVSRAYLHYRIVHVPGRHWHPDTKRSSVLVHPANRTDQLLGCISPGSRHLDLNKDGIVDIADSMLKLAWLTKNLPVYFELQIGRKPA